MNLLDYPKLTDFLIDKKKTVICLTIASSITLIYIYKNRNTNSFNGIISSIDYFKIKFQ